MTAILAEWAAARRALAEHAASRVVGIDRGRGVRFSGIVWDSQTVVTAAEALQGADSVVVHTAQAGVPAEILACDLSVDVAVLNANTGGPGVSAATSTAPRAGDEVLVAGRGRSGSSMLWTHLEEVGPAWRSRSGGELDRLIRLSPGLRPAFEGGGAFDLDGRFAAMPVRGPRHQTLGIPCETIERIVAAVRRHGRLPQPYLGVRVQPVRLDEALRCELSRSGPDAVLVVGIEPESPAAAVPLIFGDLILAVAGQAIETAVDLKIALSRAPVGAAVDVRIQRAGIRLDTRVVVHDRNGR